MSYKLPEDCGYNKIYKHQWKTGNYGLPMSSVEEINNLISGKWGWYFKPFPDMNYHDEKWFERQECIITFERRWELIQARFCVKISDD